MWLPACIGVIGYPIFYTHAAPLGLNAAQLVARYRSWGRGHLVQRVGEPNPYAYNFACSPSNFCASRIPVDMSPLGVNAAQLVARYRSWGRGLLVQRVGEPNPYAYNFGCSPSNFCASRIPVDMSPLGVNAAQLVARYRSWGRGLLAQRVGEPNPYAYNFGCSPSNFCASRIPVDMSPPGGKCGTIGGAVSIVGERSPCPAGWGTQPLRIQLRLLTFQFLCLPYSG